MWRAPAALAIATLCVAPASAQSTDPALAKRSNEMATAFNARDAAKVGALYTEDAVLMPPNTPMVKGRAAIEAWFKGGFDDGFSNLRLAPFRTDVSGDLAYVAGTYTISGKSSTGSFEDRGKYVEVWKRSGGQWRIATDIFNSDLPPPPAPPK
jgi:uncharacterized protein (TIGR02246 family)